MLGLSLGLNVAIPVILMNEGDETTILCMNEHESDAEENKTEEEAKVDHRVGDFVLGHTFELIRGMKYGSRIVASLYYPETTTPPPELIA